MSSSSSPSKPTLASPQLIPIPASSVSFPPSAGTPQIYDPTISHALDTASRLLASDELVAFPTETVYGLGASALSPSAVKRIFDAKGRPQDNPLIVHVSSRAMLDWLLPEGWVVPEIYERLMARFWPGPLTLLFPTSSKIPPETTAGQPTVAVRLPAHPVARALIAHSGIPLAAPSANSSGRPSPTAARHVWDDLAAKGRVPLVLDGGECGVGVESTVVDGLGADGKLRVLRPGGVTVEMLQECLGGGGEDVLVWQRDYQDEKQREAPSTPGMKYKHYSPDTRVLLLLPAHARRYSYSSSSDLPTPLSAILSSLPAAPAPHRIGLMTLPSSPLTLSLFPTSYPTAPHTLHTPSGHTLTLVPFPLGEVDRPDVTAQRIFAGLHQLDKARVELIVVEGVREEREGLAVMNRLRKAAGVGGVWEVQ